MAGESRWVTLATAASEACSGGTGLTGPKKQLPAEEDRHFHTCQDSFHNTGLMTSLHRDGPPAPVPDEPCGNFLSGKFLF
jgi:hypothetical protein